MVALGSCDLGAAQTAAALDLDAACAHSHGATHGVLHRAAEADALLKLLCDVLGDELCVGVRGANLNDGESDGLADQLLDFLTQALDLCAALADNDTGAGAVDINANLCGIALYLDGGNTGGIEGLLQILADLVVLDDKIADLVFSCVPAGIPILYNANTQSVGINFLSHLILPPSLSLSQPQRS